MKQLYTIKRSEPSARAVARGEQADKRHVIVRLVATREEPIRGDSGRLVLDDDMELPDVPVFWEPKGR